MPPRIPKLGKAVTNRHLALWLHDLWSTQQTPDPRSHTKQHEQDILVRVISCHFVDRSGSSNAKLSILEVEGLHFVVGNFNFHSQQRGRKRLALRVSHQ